MATTGVPIAMRWGKWMQQHRSGGSSFKWKQCVKNIQRERKGGQREREREGGEIGRNGNKYKCLCGHTKTPVANISNVLLPPPTGKGSMTTSANAQTVENCKEDKRGRSNSRSKRLLLLVFWPLDSVSATARIRDSNF